MGKFNVESPIVKLLPNGRDIELVDLFIYTDDYGVDWVALPGDIVNGASIPRFLWSITGSPYVGKYRNAAIFHDVYCESKTRPCDITHRMFLGAMRDSNVSSFVRNKMYAAVKTFGPRW